MYLGLGAETDSSDILVMSFQQPNALHIHISSSTTWISFSDTLELVLHTKVSISISTRKHSAAAITAITKNSPVCAYKYLKVHFLYV
jgi:hypothetical protein